MKCVTMRRMGLAAGLLALGLLAGCSGKAGDAEVIAQTALEGAYSCGAGDSAAFETALAESVTDDEAALNEYWVGRMGEDFTEEGLDTLTANRVATRVLTTWPDTAVEVAEVALEEAYSGTDSQANYTYTVKAGPEGITPVTFTGQIGLVRTDDGWLVSRLE